MKQPTSPYQARKRRALLTAAVNTALVLTIAVVGTLLAYRTPWMYDMTAGKVFSLSPASLSLLQELEQTVEIAAVYPQGEEEPMVASLLGEYVKASDGRLRVEYIDAERNPAALAGYSLGVAGVGNGTLIVRCAGRSKFIGQSSLFQTTSAGEVFWGERQITGAIRYVTTDEMPLVYLLEGHEETGATTGLAAAVQALETEVYQVNSLTLLKSGGVPQDCDILLIVSPKRDITPEEATMLEDYFRRGGKAMVLVDAMSTNANLLPNLNTLMHSFGLDIGNNFVVEEDPASHLSNNNMYLIPAYGYHAITKTLAENKRYPLVPVAMGLRTLEYDKETLQHSMLLATSAKSWMRTDMNSTTPAKTEADISGPIPIAYAVLKSNGAWGRQDARLVLMGNSTFISDAYLDTQANRDFFMNAIGWLQGSRELENISPKLLQADKLIIRGDSFMRLTFIVVLALPLTAFIGALLMWAGRRNQ